LRSSQRRLLLPVVLAVAAFMVAACGSSNDPSGGSGGPDGTAPAASDVDYESLSGTLNGSGATFPKAFYEEAIAEFSGGVAPDVVVNYGGGGSGKGKTDLAEQVVQWAGTDSLVKDEEKSNFKGGEFLYFPTVAAPITVSYNLDGVSELQLSPDTLAGIFQADITTWDAAEIKADNPDATLPSTPITVVHRSDGSGTTSNFTKYLAAAAPDTWTLGSGDTVDWSTSTQAGNGNNGVAQIVTQTDGAVGYVDLSDAKASDLSFASIKNKDGNYVAPTLEAASAALAGAEVKDDLTYSALNASGADAYPITASTYVLVYKVQPDQATGDALQGWIRYLLTDAQEFAADVDFAKLPDGLRDRAIAQLDELEIG
jgi:phosphate transport system substrate-binding protein